MKIHSSKNKHTHCSKKLIIPLIILGVILIGGTSLYAYQKNLDSKKDQTTTKSSDANSEQTKNGQDIKAGTVNSDQPSSETDKGSDGNTTAPNNVAVTITSPTEQTGDTFTVRSYVNISTTAGTCTVTLTHQGQTTVTQSLSGLQPQSSISSCQTFNISTTNLVKGKWNLTVSFSDGSNSAGTTTEEVTLN